MVVTRRRSTPESPQTPVLVHETQEAVKSNWTTPIQFPKLLPVELLNNTTTTTTTSAKEAYYPLTRQRTAKLQKTLKTLVSELTEESISMLLKLAGKETNNNSIRLGQKVEQVFRLLQGEDSVVRELCSVGIFPSWPCDMVNSCDEESTIPVEEHIPGSTARDEYLTQVEEGSIVFRANICQGEKIGLHQYSMKTTLFEEKYEIHSTSRRTSGRKRARSKTRINHGLFFHEENISSGV